MPQTFTDLTAAQKERAIQAESRIILRELGLAIRGRNTEPVGLAMQNAIDRIRTIATNRAESKSYAAAQEQGLVDPGPSDV